ncbi:MAG: CpXC domain-containing protein [Labilithrix sp.]
MNCPGCGLDVPPSPPHECAYRNFAKQIMVRLVAQADAPPPSIDGIQGYTLRTVTSLPELVEKVRIFDAGLNDAVVELCKISFVMVEHSLLNPPRLYFQTLDDRGALSFAALPRTEVPAFVAAIPRAFYDDKLRRRAHDLVEETSKKGVWLRVDANYIRAFDLKQRP